MIISTRTLQKTIVVLLSTLLLVSCSNPSERKIPEQNSSGKELQKKSSKKPTVNLGLIGGGWEVQLTRKILTTT